MAIISLGTINKTLIPVLLGALVCFLNRFLNSYKETLLFKNATLTVICISSSRLLAIIPLLKIKLKYKEVNKNNKIILGNNKRFKSLVKRNEEIIKNKWSFILLLAIIFCIYLFCFVLTFEIETNSWIWYILFSSIFYYLFFKVKLYKHHYLSSILILLIGVIIDLVTENLQNDIKNNIVFLLIKYLNEIIFSLFSVFAKYVMEKKYISVYELSFYIGIIATILSGILLIFDYYFIKEYNYDEYFYKFNIKELIIILLEIITQFALNITTLFTIKNNSPCHSFIIFVFGQLAHYVDFKGTSIVVIICLIFILFLSLIFNEIIEINCLNYHIIQKEILQIELKLKNIF